MTALYAKQRNKMLKRLDRIAQLEQAAIAGHRHGESWQAYFRPRLATVAELAKTDAEGFAELAGWLEYLLTNGDRTQRLEIAPVPLAKAKKHPRPTCDSRQPTPPSSGNRAGGVGRGLNCSLSPVAGRSTSAVRRRSP